jgi:GH24 family phage-related lysozyme (muramidase)
LAAAFSDIQVVLLAVLALAQLIVFGLLQWRALGLAARPIGQSVLPVPTAPPAPQSLPGPIPARPLPVPAPASAPISTQPVDVVDQGLVNFIKKEEGFTPKAMWDYKQYSIGYGTKANSATEVITEPEAAARLTVEVDKAYSLVKSIIPAGTPVGIVQALVDLTYNAGSGWESQSLGAAVKASKWDTVKADILQYNHAGGVVNAGLTSRREAEVSWFDSPL